MSHYNEKMGLVYFIKPVGMDGPIKIGHSQCPADRIICLGAWSPWPLEIIGSVPAPSKDEIFLHRCFADSHSHREWFHSTPILRETISRIIAANTVDCVRDELKPIGSIRSARTKSPLASRRMSFRMRIYWALRRLDERDGPSVYWKSPAEISAIMDRWCKNFRTKTDGCNPTPEELVALERFISNPEETAVRHERTLRVVA